MPLERVDTLTSVGAAATDTTAQQAADTVAAPRVIRSPFEMTHCHAVDAPSPTLVSGQQFTTGRKASSYGITGELRPMLPGYDTGVMCLLIGTFLILSANFRHYSTFLKTFMQDLWKVRNRSNVFDDHTMSETRVMASFVMLLCVSEGIIIYSSMMAGIGNVPIFSSIAMVTFIAIVYYLIQVMVYRMVGYAFTSTENATQWVKGFKASQSLLGIGLVVPALVVLFNPGTTAIVTIIALTLYVIARIIFIFKGFRIFYTDNFSLLYFILYLCALEILPPILLCKLALKIALLL